MYIHVILLLHNIYLHRYIYTYIYIYTYTDSVVSINARATVIFNKKFSDNLRTNGMNVLIGMTMALHLVKNCNRQRFALYNFCMCCYHFYFFIYIFIYTFQ